MILRNRSLRSSTLASFGLPGAHASAWADSARNCRSSSLSAGSLAGMPTSWLSFFTAAQAAARGLLRRYAGLPAREGRAKLSQALARRGFSWDAVRAAVDAVWEADDWDE